MKEICAICSNKTNSAWLFNLAKFDSLDERCRMRFHLCEPCAKKLMKAMRIVLQGSGATGKNGRLETVIACPTCGKEKATQEPKAPSPCEDCGTIFSIYSAAKSDEG